MESIRKIVFVLLVAIPCLYANAQDNSDAKRLAALSYMEMAHKLDCANPPGDNLSHKICLNLQFQNVDSTMNARFATFLQTVSNDSLKAELVEYQKQWVNNRRLQSQIESDNMRGHMLGIYYLSTMIECTNARLQELEHLLRNE